MRPAIPRGYFAADSSASTNCPACGFGLRLMYVSETAVFEECPCCTTQYETPSVQHANGERHTRAGVLQVNTIPAADSVFHPSLQKEA